MNQKQRMMKTKAMLFLLALLFGTISAFAQNDPHNPNNYWNDQGCWGTINIEVGETKTISCANNIPNLSKLRSIIWEEHYSAGYIKVTSQNWTSCTIEGMTSGTDKQLWCLYEYGDQPYPYNTYKAYYLVNVTSKGKLNLSASPAGGNVAKGTKVYLTADQPGADIYYEINGYVSTSSPKYTSDGITIEGPCTLNAIATKRGYDSSDRMSWVYSVTESKPEGLEINATNFPDENFRNYLLEMSYGKDGVITDEEIKKITVLLIYGTDIKSLKGIEYFTELTQLWCYDNLLTSLDVSKNTALTSLYCMRNQLTALDVSGCTALKSFQCYENLLTFLDVSKNAALTSLDCYGNQLTALDVSKNAALTSLDCYGNQLTALDVSKNAALTYLRCSHNQLMSLDVSGCTALESFQCYDNQLTFLDVSQNTALKYLYCCSNQIKESAMDALISSLPQNVTNEIHRFWVNDNSKSDEGNICTKSQVAAVKAKGWTPQYYDYDSSEWQDYEGSEDYSEEPDNPVTPDNPTAPVSIALPDIETVNVNSTIQLAPTLEPADAVTELTWASDDETIAKVTSTGKVAGIKAGTAIISVRTSNGLTAECFIIVQDTSGIEDVKTGGNADAPIYTLSGQKVANVKKGIYIVNGKKVIVK